MFEADERLDELHAARNATDADNNAMVRQVRRTWDLTDMGRFLD
jgi:hypothetical protein